MLLLYNGSLAFKVLMSGLRNESHKNTETCKRIDFRFKSKLHPFLEFLKTLIKCAFDNSRYWLFIEPQNKVMKTAGNFVYQLFYWPYNLHFFSFFFNDPVLCFCLFLEFTFLSLHSCTKVNKKITNNKYLRKQR